MQTSQNKVHPLDLLIRVSESFLLFPQKSIRSQAEADDFSCLNWNTGALLSCSCHGTVPPRHTSILTVSRWYFGSLARFTFSVRVCHTRTQKTPCVSVKSSTGMTRELFTKCGSWYLCAVVCFRLQFLHCCYLFQKIRFLHSWLRTTTLEYSFGMRQDHLKTHSKSLERKRQGKGLRKTFRPYIFVQLQLCLEISYVPVKNL